MSIFEGQQAIEEQRLQEVRAQGETTQPLEGNLEKLAQEGASDGADVYRDRVERLEQRDAERRQAAQERALKQNEISFGSRAAENAEKKLEEKAKLERQIKQKEEALRIHNDGLDQAVRENSRYYTEKRTQEIKQDAREIKKLEKKISEL